MDETPSTLPAPIQRLNSYASSSSSSGVATNFHSKSLSQNLSCESSRSNFSTFESLDLNLSDCSDLAGSLPSCASSSAQTTIDTTVDGKYYMIKLFLKCFLVVVNKNNKKKYIFNHFTKKKNQKIKKHLTYLAALLNCF